MAVSFRAKKKCGAGLREDRVELVSLKTKLERIRSECENNTQWNNKKERKIKILKIFAPAVQQSTHLAKIII